MSVLISTDPSSSSRLGTYAAIALTATGIGAYIGYSLSKSKSFEKQLTSCPFASNASSAPSGARCPFSGATVPSSTLKSNQYTHPNNPYANAKPLTPEQIALVKATAPVMAEHGVTITTHFYKRMFDKVPALNNIFNRANQATGEQPRALAAAVHAYAANIDNLGALGDAVNKIAQKHCSLNITADQYTIVGEHLIASVAEVLGPALDAKTAEAWIAAYAQLANILIGAEAKLYQDAAKIQGGWNGWRKFIVYQKVIESSTITSFYLRPSDSQPLPTCQPGQYISIKLYVPSLGYHQPRQYSLTYISATNTTPAMYRISIKRESQHDISPAGVVSNLMHDTVKEGDELDVSHPMGEFTLKPGNTPIVLLSGGVGLTPMISMLQHIIQSSSTRQTLFLHGTRDRQQHAMREYIHDVVKTSQNITKYVWYQSVNEKDIKGRDYDCTGRLNLSDIQDIITPLLSTADFYICGPVPFMHAHRHTLEKMGVDASRIHTELFGTGANP